MRSTKPNAQDLVATKVNTRQYSFDPVSVWNISYHQGLKEYKELIQDDFYNPGLRKQGKGAAGVGRKGKLSEFSPLLAERILEYWSDEGDLVLDPFSGRGTRVLIAKANQRRSIGLDISWEFISHVGAKSSRKATMLDFVYDEGQFDPLAVRANSMAMPIASDSIDFIYSCPPYWKIERYEHHKDQLADIQDYKLFLDKLGEVFKECFRVLKDGKFIVMVVQDFRLWKVFYALGAHTTELLEAAGFSMYDVVIRHYTQNSPAKAPDAKAKKHTVKMHEYILVARKEVDAGPIWDIILSK